MYPGVISKVQILSFNFEIIHNVEIKLLMINYW